MREAVTLTSSEALREHVVDLVASDVPDLLAQVDGRRVKLRDREVTLATRGAAIGFFLLPDWRQRPRAAIADCRMVLLLLMIGLYGLLFEFTSPGMVAPGVIGGICLLLALFALQMLPVNYAGLGLILLGVALLAGEVVAPSFVLGIGGAVALLAGGLLLFDRDVPGMGVPLALVGGVAAASLAFVLLGGSMALRARRRPVVSGAEDMVGATGVVLASDGKGAWAEVRGERWRVTSNETLAPGQRVRVLALRGLTLEVAPGTWRNLMIFNLGFGALVPLVILLLAFSVRVLREYQRGVVFQLGRFWRVKGPGLVLVIPGIQQMVRVDLRVVTMVVEPQMSSRATTSR